MRSPIFARPLLCLTLFAALSLMAGCELLTDGQGVSPSDTDDAGSSTSPSSACNLACVQGSHCELQGQSLACVPDGVLVTPPAADAGGAAPSPITPPLVACNLACILGSHCVVGSQGPACVSDTTPVVVDAGPPAPVACSLLCAVGRHCKITGQGPACVLDKPSLDAGPPVETPCGTTSCAADEQCCSASCGLCEPKGGLCPAIACAPPDAALPKSTCASTLCPTGHYCDDITGTPECKALPSCETAKCPAGTNCELVQVQCIRAPCPPLPECVPSAPQVCNLACKVGTHCVVFSNGPTCVPDPGGGGACGKKTCGANQICCNASCGICGSPNGACPAIACAPVDVAP